MSDPHDGLDDHQLTEWDALAAAAPVGPWVWEDADGRWLRSGADSVLCTSLDWDDTDPDAVPAAELVVDPDAAALIAAARTAVPALVAEVRRLRDEARRLDVAYRAEVYARCVADGRTDRLIRALWASRRRWQEEAEDHADSLAECRRVSRCQQEDLAAARRDLVIHDAATTALRERLASLESRR